MRLVTQAHVVLISAHQLSFLQDMALDCLIQFLPAHFRFALKINVKCIVMKEMAWRLATMPKSPKLLRLRVGRSSFSSRVPTQRS